MNSALYHLILNRLPIIAPMAGLVVLISSFVFRSEVVKRISFLIAAFLLTFF